MSERNLVLYTRKKQEEMLETGVQRESVTFPNGEITMAGDLYLPRDFDESKQYAAIICVHTGTGVKEQVSGDYAAMLAGEGYVTLAYDASYQGESGGEPRFLENPEARISDVSRAVDFFETLSYVDSERIGVFGVCAGGGYATKAACLDHRIKALGTVSSAQMGGEPYEESKDRPDYYVSVIPEADESTAESNPQFAHFAKDAYEYYKTGRGQWPTSESRIPYVSFKYLEGFNAYDLVPTELVQPVMMVVGENAMTRILSDNAIANANVARSRELVVIDGAYHFDLYDKEEYVSQAMANLTRFYGENL